MFGTVLPHVVGAVGHGSPGRFPGSVSGAGDPKASARVIGNAGTAVAGEIARDASKAASVPGYAGKDLPERNIGANALEDDARARLNDPDDPGGDAGRTVIDGKHGLTGPEFVRFATLAAIEDRRPAAAEDTAGPTDPDDLHA